MDYLTRHLVARVSMPYLGKPLNPGDPFHATPVDADYLVRCKKAVDADASPAAEQNSPSPAAVLAPVIEPEPAPVAQVVVPVEAPAAPIEAPAPEVPAEEPAAPLSVETEAPVGTEMAAGVDGSAETAPEAPAEPAEQTTDNTPVAAPTTPRRAYTRRGTSTK